MKIHPYISATIVSIIFGFSFMFTKNALDFVTASQLVALRFTIAAFALSLLCFLCKIRIRLADRSLGKVLLLALLQPVIYYPLETLGVKLTSSSEAGLIIALIPVFVTLLAIYFLKEIPNLKQILSILISVVGVALIVAGGAHSMSNGQTLGFFALLGAVLVAALYFILSRYLSKEFSPVELTFVMMWIGAIFFNGAAIFEALSKGIEVNYFAMLKIKEVWVSGIYLGIFSSVIAFFGMNYTLARIEASRNAVFSNLSTIVSVVAGVCLRGEPFFWGHLVGGFFILLGVWGVNKYRKRDVFSGTNN